MNARDVAYQCSICGCVTQSGYLVNGTFHCTDCEHRHDWYWACISQPKPTRSAAKTEYLQRLEEHLKTVTQ